ncbi:hypothetical protein [Caldicellulosiruptor bescii]|uniref:hypothetical protein n=1 Tax=Caldicellulosiruptor bescii TaxID=31899 RepID=UPI00211C6537|nr:hypothetical protein [Caldicellulosiruptor bescii]
MKMKDPLLLLLAMSGCLLVHLFTHKAMMGSGCHGHDHPTAMKPKKHLTSKIISSITITTVKN